MEDVAERTLATSDKDLMEGLDHIPLWQGLGNLLYENNLFVLSQWAIAVLPVHISIIGSD